MIFETIQLQHSTHTHHSLQLHSHQQQPQQQLRNPHQHHSLQHRFLDEQDLDQDGNRQRHRFNDDAELELKSLDFGLTKRLLAAVFFLLVIYAWKQYIDEDEESDTIYI